MSSLKFKIAVANKSEAMEQIPFEKRGNRSTTGRGNAKNIFG